MFRVVMTTLLKNVGFGFAVKGAENMGVDNSLNPYNIASAAIGTFLWCVGCYLEHKDLRESLEDLPDDTHQETDDFSTSVIKQGFAYAGGYGVAKGVNKFVTMNYSGHGPKGVLDVASNVLSAAGSLTIFMSGIPARHELDNASHHLEILPLKWEKSRILMVSVADLCKCKAISYLFTWKKPDALFYVTLPLGIMLTAGEWIYGKRNDVGLSTINQLNRRGMKVGTIFSLLFMGYDLAMKKYDARTMIDDSFSLVLGGLYFATMVKLSRIAKSHEHERAARIVNLSSDLSNSLEEGLLEHSRVQPGSPRP